MTTPDLERRLTDLLRERSEGAMERTDTEGRLASLLEDGERTLHRRRRWAAAGGVVVAAAGVAVALWLSGGGGDRADDPDPIAPKDDTVALATSFLEANFAYDLDRAQQMLTPDAVIDDGGVPEWRTWREWNRAAGISLADHSCQRRATTSAGTEVRCVFELHGLGSEQLGLGPYGGNTYDLTIRDGKIVKAAEVNPYLANGFSTESWEPFADWVLAQHSEDVLAMYDDGSRTGARLTPRSFRLWEQRVAEYVDWRR